MKIPLNIMALSGSIWERFVKFFSPEFYEYDNFNLNETSFVAIKYIIIGIFFGTVIASASALYNRRVLGKFIRALIKQDATSPESAKTLAELGFDKNPFIKYSLVHGYTLKKSTSCVEYEEHLRSLDGSGSLEKSSGEEAEGSENAREAVDTAAEVTSAETKQPKRISAREALYGKEFIPDVKSAHFYIPEDKKYLMDVKFEAKGSNWLTFILTVIAAFLMTGAAVLFLPDILQLADNFINLISGK